MAIRVSLRSGYRLAVVGSLIVCLTGPLSPSPSAAETLRVNSPAQGIVVRITVGDTLWQSTETTGVPGVVIQAPVLATWGSLERVDLPTGAGLFITREKKLRACQTTQTFSLQGMNTVVFGNCLTDDNDDGTFDRVSYSDGGFSKKLSPPVTYARSVVSMDGGGAPSFQRRLIYLGSDSSTLRIGYREFSGGMARPAFSEDLSLPLSGQFPQPFAVKGIRFTITALDATALTYKLDSE